MQASSGASMSQSLPQAKDVAEMEGQEEEEEHAVG